MEAVSIQRSALSQRAKHMRDFREIKAWQKGHSVTLAVYKATATFPKEELFGLTSQMRRASMSVEANIAEGCGRDGDAELARFLQIAMGSASELECHLVLATDLGLLSANISRSLINDTVEVKRMLAAFLKKLKADR